MAGLFDEISGRLEPQKAYNWVVEINSSDPSFSKISMNAKTTSVPAKLMDVQKRYFCGKKYHVPTKDTSPNIFTVTFWDNQNMDVYNYFYEWYSEVSKGMAAIRSKPPVGFKRQVELHLLSDDGESISGSYFLYGAFVSEIGDMPLSYGDSSEVTVDVRISFDELDYVKFVS